MCNSNPMGRHRCCKLSFLVRVGSVSASTFNGMDSSLRLIVNTQRVSFGDQFGISFRTRDATGVVLLVRLFSKTNTRVDHMLLSLDENTGALQLETKFGIGEAHC